jgi:Flp pilus assembly protein TadD
VKHDRDLATASRFFTRALELKPGDPYALNSLAAVSQELGDLEKALLFYRQSIKIGRASCRERVLAMV